MIKKLAKFYLDICFPNECLTKLGTGARSSVFKTESGNVIRIKPLWKRTYSSEEKVLNFLKDMGGLGCQLPEINSFVKFPFAISIHSDLGGSTTSFEKFTALPIDKQNLFAKQLFDTIITLVDYGKSTEAKKLFKTNKNKVSSQLLYYIYLLNKRELLYGWVKLKKEYAIMSKQAVLVNNDLNFSNMLIDENHNLIGLIDLDTIQYSSFESCLRKLEPPLIDIIKRLWIDRGNHINHIIFKYHRARYILSRLLKRKSKYDRLYLMEVLKITLLEK
jgi:hypothetical protein